ncbi:CD209 antigen-like protein C isoform X4 [Ctenopharyngodon idella]|uniref:CD209 antigen-like protein C isoform X4 n=1 Tax=Ctenopharyngodon idella TaxID=7959 RepID=UPI0022317C45|nr:CD209 antigen-like protein C isoform X4 [Ctenopharyngodon idella]
MSSYGNINIPGTHGMDSEDEEEMNIYANIDPINSFDFRTETKNSDTKRHQTPQHTESDSVKIRSSREAPVCLVLLCVLLLTAVIVLGVYIHTKSTNYTEERNQLLNMITNLTEETQQLLINLTEERDQLLANNTNLTEERGQLLTRTMQLTKERDGLSSNNNDLIKERNKLNQEKNELLKMDGWVRYQSSLYFISSAWKSWTESRRYCTDRGADLIIINNKEEQDFIKKMSCTYVWIGLTDSDVEGRWRWVDGSTLTSGFWSSKEPDGQRGENCALTHASGWADYPCNDNFQCICEKSILN